MKARFSIALCFSLIAAIAVPCSAARIHDENFYQEWFCSMYGGQRELMFPDNTRCDCLLPFVAVEVEFADKWYEGLGQSLYYGTWARRAPGIALVIENEETGTKYLHRLMRTIHNYGVDIRVFPIFLDLLGESYEMWP